MDPTGKFKSNPLFDAILASGAALEKSKLKPNITSEVASKALQSYKEHKKDLKIGYTELLTTVEKNFSDLQNSELPPEARLLIAAHLKHLANERIFKQEGPFSSLHTYLEKCHQLAQGHGFRTKGEWGIKLADKLEKETVKSLQATIKSCIENPRNSPVSDKLMVEVNLLDKSHFEGLINNSIFVTKSGREQRQPAKYEFYSKLTPEKKKIFDLLLLNREDWLTQIHEIIANVIRDNKGLEEPTEDFLKALPQELLIDRCKQFSSHITEKLKNGSFKDGWERSVYEFAQVYARSNSKS